MSTLKPHYTEEELETIAESFTAVSRDAALGVLQDAKSRQQRLLHGQKFLTFNPTPEDIADAIGVAVSAAFLAFVLSQTDAVREAVEVVDNGRLISVRVGDGPHYHRERLRYCRVHGAFEVAGGATD